MTADAVKAADEAWAQAEIRGDHAYLAWLLADGYASVSASGKATTKAQLVEGARKRGDSPETAKRFKEWKDQHPSRADVQLVGDTAILTWVSTEPAAAARVNSSDIFVYRDGHWHAVYSQHASIESKP
ncbi:MAG: nuclear transport factor 2 family protein [Dokdonella sp.]|uniref:nuclear transport factor 2 family protein n=1 Tax=Dokdonella sp. TaxID=2291710 RepID=UPI003F7DF50F